MKELRASSRVKRIQFHSLALVVIICLVGYIDRATLSVANVLVRHELGATVSQMGLLLSAFLWIYALLQLPVGPLVDRLGPRRLLTLGLIVWSCAQIVGGVAGSLTQLFIARLLLGLGEAPLFSTGAKVVREWFNVGGRGLATGIFISSGALGTAISAPLLTHLMTGFGWRWMFIVMGGMGFVFAALWYWLYRTPSEASLSAAEIRYLALGSDVSAERSTVTFQSWRTLFKSPTCWGMIIGDFGVIYTFWIFVTWLPGYLEMARHMSISQSGWWSAVPFVSGVIGSLVGGLFGDKLHARGLSPVNSRRYPVAVAMILVACCILFGALTPDNTLAVGAISVALFLTQFAVSNQWSLVTVAAPKELTGSLASIQNFGGYVGGALAPMVTGFIVQESSSFAPALFVTAGVSLIGGLAYAFLVRKPIVIEGVRSSERIGHECRYE